MKLVIIDSNALVHRAYHALPPLTTKKGVLVNAVYGFLLVFLKTLKDLKPNYIAACFDFPAPSFRQKMFTGYKAKRPKAPEELYAQIPKIKEILKSFNIPLFEKQEFEADDLIATIAKIAQTPHHFYPKSGGGPEIEIYILTGDLDALQLVNKNVKVYALGKGIKETVIYDEEKVKERFGILPKQVVDFKALAGDPSDNIPGATGIGKKRAAELLQEYGSITELYKAIEKGEAWDLKPKVKEILLDYKDQVFLSYDLAKARMDADIDFNLEKCQWKPPSLEPKRKEKIVEMLKEYNFYSLTERLP
ncbi:hypothetical protein KAU51_03120 [Candidatus Parcubacteria bacterium]|nr:hypothetical protein [Candidatus Parcubacteria bacterium]